MPDKKQGLFSSKSAMKNCGVSAKLQKHHEQFDIKG